MQHNSIWNSERDYWKHSESYKVKHLRNIYIYIYIYIYISIRVKEKESSRNQVLCTVNIYRTKISLLINYPQKQKFILEFVPIVQLWALENKTAISISDQKLKKVLGELKV